MGGAVEGGAAEGGGVIEGGGAIEGGGGAIEGEGGVADRVEVEGGAVIRPDLAVEVFIVLDYSAYSL